ncbi:MAG TPA: hypothetical protein VLJ86_22475 [Ramlibacter sp.]|nr:hypothetical protein [Ramlibacter sp.]
MYSESDIDGAVQAGVLPIEAAAAFRDHVAHLRSAPAVDEEQFRLITGFNDIFVSIALVLMLASIAWLGGTTFGGAGVFITAWGLAEYFTRKRRMALPSILLHLAFVGAVLATVYGLPAFPSGTGRDGWRLVAALGTAALASWLHWRRFKVPVTVAVLVGAALGTLFALLITVVPALQGHVAWMAFVAGAAVFAVAMAWDMSDPLRKTLRADVAFWLHLLASPLLVHSVFTGTGLAEGSGAMGYAAAVLAAYLLLAAVALVVDRRAMMVSALAYVLFALTSLFKEFGLVNASMALTALLIGSALLLLSAIWAQARAQLLRPLPTAWRGRLPPAA